MDRRKEEGRERKKGGKGRILALFKNFLSLNFINIRLDINVYGRPLYLTLIARRSNEFAGTRFLKRGLNDMVS